ncbi:MAG: hypothetical protein P4L53_21000 [Candidatus Obscuribacterales bacterium]|nr:hypothetical protein [Candidatus Obscuribacterales bacterium]
MSDTVLTLPAENEVAVVERFTEASRDLIPGMQISLARRIVRPGSDQVLCLNATTSVPMQDDEIASVSDLALKLSDGTNVRISLSFFNDGNECPSFNQNQTASTPQFQGQGYSRRQSSYSYDPDRYSMHSVKNEVHNHSNITSAMLVASAVALLGLCASINGPASYSALWVKLKQAAAGTPSAKPVEANKVKVSDHVSNVAAVSNFAKPPSVVPSAARVKTTKPTQTASIVVPKVAAKPHHSSAKSINFAAPPNMMVPPPPATYTISPAQLFSPAEIAAMQPAPASAKTSLNSATRSEKAPAPLPPAVSERPKLKPKAVSNIPEFDDENAVPPNAGLELVPPTQFEQNSP